MKTTILLTPLLSTLTLASWEDWYANRPVPNVPSTTCTTTSMVVTTIPPPLPPMTTTTSSIVNPVPITTTPVTTTLTTIWQTTTPAMNTTISNPIATDSSQITNTYNPTGNWTSIAPTRSTTTIPSASNPIITYTGPTSSAGPSPSQYTGAASRNDVVGGLGAVAVAGLYLIL